MTQNLITNKQLKKKIHPKESKSPLYSTYKIVHQTHNNLTRFVSVLDASTCTSTKACG